MRNNDFNPEKKLQEWQQRPAIQKQKKKRRLSIILLLFNIVVIVLAYMIMSKSRNQPVYYTAKTDHDNIEYRLSLTENSETITYGITLTITNIKEDVKMIYPDNDISDIFISYNGDLITRIPIINSKNRAELKNKPLIYTTKLNKDIIDVYIKEKHLVLNNKKSFLNTKHASLSVDVLLYIKNRTEPLRVTFDHEAAR